MDDIEGVAVTALAGLRAALEALAAVAPGQVSDGEVAALVVQTEAAARQLAGVQLAAVAEGVTRGLPLASGSGTGRSAPARWVRSLIPVSPGDAARRAELAVALFTGQRSVELAPTREAVLAGSISLAHAGTVVGAIERLQPPGTPADVVDAATRAEAQTLLLRVAAGDGEHQAVDPTQLARAATTLTATLDPGHGERLARDEDAQHEQRAFAVTPTSSGMCHAGGLLTREVGHALIGVLQALSAPRPAADGTPDPRTAAMRTHDGLGQAVRLLQGTDDVLPGSHGSPNRLVVSVDVRTLAAHLGLGRPRAPRQHGDAARAGQHPPGRRAVPPPAPLRVPELPGGWPLSPLGAQVMACDADLVAILTGPDGTPLDVADTVYPFSRRQRAAVIDRDRHCSFGSCTAPPAWCQVHHLDPFSGGGPTTVANAALLCGVHHRYVHAQHLVGTRSAVEVGASGGSVRWRAPTGSLADPGLPPPAVSTAITALATRWHRRQRRPGGSASDRAVDDALGQ